MPGEDWDHNSGREFDSTQARPIHIDAEMPAPAKFFGHLKPDLVTDGHLAAAKCTRGPAEAHTLALDWQRLTEK